MAGALASLLGILQSFTSPGKIYWLYKFPSSSPFASFIYQNYFAAYAAITAIVALAAVVVRLHRHMRFDGKLFFLILSFTIITTALFLSKSRGGILLFTVSIIFFSVCAFSRRRSKNIILIIGAVILAAALLLGWIGFKPVANELRTLFTNEESYNDRVTAYSEALEIIKDHPLKGIGIGAFVYVFPRYRSVAVLEFYKYLHNDILQFAVEAGMPALILLIFLFSVFLIYLIKSVSGTSSDYKYYTGLGLLSALLYLYLHSSFDFILHSPAIAALATLFLAVSISLSGWHGGNIDIKKRVICIIKNPRRARVLAGILFACLFFPIIMPLAADLTSVIALNPGNDSLYFRRYQSLFLLWESGRITEADFRGKALPLIENARRLNPYNTVYIIAEGEIELIGNNYEKASLFFREASFAEPNNPFTQMAYACSLFQWAAAEDSEREKGILIKKGLVYYNKAKALDRNINIKSLMKNEASYIYLRSSLRKKGIDVY